ncbi:MAG: GNAT family protein [Chloroflexi bacterium]|nr:GNAT family protein [Chloroflexota bacterium]
MDEVVLRCKMLLMRPLETRDVEDILALATAKEITDNTFVPVPYPPEAAEEFVRTRRELWSKDEAYVFGIIEKSSDRFAGCMGLHPLHDHFRAEVGYWIGVPFWGRGLATAALRLLIQFGFETLKLNRIEAGHFEHNIASGRVMQKADMRFEGVRRQAFWHRDRFKDAHWYAILREDYPLQLPSTKEETAED